MRRILGLCRMRLRVLGSAGPAYDDLALFPRSLAALGSTRSCFWQLLASAAHLVLEQTGVISDDCKHLTSCVLAFRLPAHPHH